VKTILRTAEYINLSFGLCRFLDILFLFVSRKFSPKPSEDGFPENLDFLAIGGEQNELRIDMHQTQIV